MMTYMDLVYYLLGVVSGLLIPILKDIIQYLKDKIIVLIREYKGVCIECGKNNGKSIIGVPEGYIECLLCNKVQKRTNKFYQLKI